MNDASHVPSGLAAVGRYALPNPTPATYRFVLLPPEGTRIRCGAVTPKFNQAGGGVEVLIKDSLPEGNRIWTAAHPGEVSVRLHLNERLVDHLCGLPETRMGYQIVDVVLSDGQTDSGHYGLQFGRNGVARRSGQHSARGHS